MNHVFDIRKVGSDHWLEAVGGDRGPVLVRKFPTKRAAAAARTIMVGKWIPLDKAVVIITDDARASVRRRNCSFEEGLKSSAESFAIVFGFNAGLPFPQSSELEAALAALSGR